MNTSNFIPQEYANSYSTYLSLNAQKNGTQPQNPMERRLKTQELVDRYSRVGTGELDTIVSEYDENSCEYVAAMQVILHRSHLLSDMLDNHKVSTNGGDPLQLYFAISYSIRLRDFRLIFKDLNNE